jgi:hypothetical protein
VDRLRSYSASTTRSGLCPSNPPNEVTPPLALAAILRQTATPYSQFGVGYGARWGPTVGSAGTCQSRSDRHRLPGENIEKPIDIQGRFRQSK